MNEAFEAVGGNSSTLDYLNISGWWRYKLVFVCQTNGGTVMLFTLTCLDRWAAGFLRGFHGRHAESPSSACEGRGLPYKPVRSISLTMQRWRDLKAITCLGCWSNQAEWAWPFGQTWQVYPTGHVDHPRLIVTRQDGRKKPLRKTASQRSKHVEVNYILFLPFVWKIKRKKDVDIRNKIVVRMVHFRVPLLCNCPCLPTIP